MYFEFKIVGSQVWSRYSPDQEWRYDKDHTELLRASLSILVRALEDAKIRLQGAGMLGDDSDIVVSALKIIGRA